MNAQEQEHALVRAKLQKLGALLERLKSDKELLFEQLDYWMKEADWKSERIAELAQASSVHKNMLTRAADALDYQLRFINEHCCDGDPDCSLLIAELRKAAQ